MNAYDFFKQNFYNSTQLDLNLYYDFSQRMHRRIFEFLSNHYQSADANAIFIKAGQDILHDSKLQASLLNILTVKLSYFFRNVEHWQSLVELLDPSSLQFLKIWSAGCSSGDEPYSLAIFLMEKFPKLRFEIYASDVVPHILDQAKIGEYDYERRLTYESVNSIWLKKYFEKDGNQITVKDFVKNRIHFIEHNLFSKPFQMNFDLIICRNVLVYFTDEGKNLAYKNFHQALKSNGILFTGPVDQIFNYENYGFSFMKTYFYQKK